MAVAAERLERPEQLSVGMMGMLIFLASEVMFFGSLFAGYFYFYGSKPEWPPPQTQPVDWWPIPMINTVILLSSGGTMHYALEGLRRGRLGRQGFVAGVVMVAVTVALLLMGVSNLSAGTSIFGGLLALFAGVFAAISALVLFQVAPFRRGRTIFLGLLLTTILLGIAFEAGQAWEFLHAHIGFGGTNQFASAFFTLTGFHGAHVLGGLLLLLLVLGRGLRGQFSPQHHVFVAAATIYWHFVDVVWVFLFFILYFYVTYLQAK
jgi:heme/copper-type cytochrome/quinol oxidase subunit 3